MNKTVLITGASGFIGGHAIRHFHGLGYRILGLSRSSNISTALKSMMDYYSLDLAIDPLPISVDIVIHIAGLADDQADWEDLYQNNYISTKRLFENVQCEKFIYISSSSVYAPINKTHKETEVIDPLELTPYGKSKWMAEQYLLKQCPPNKSIYILRPRAVYGMYDTTLLPKILNLRNGRYYFTPGKLQYDISLTHVSNLIYAMDLCINNRSLTTNNIYNVVDDKSYVLNDVIKTIMNLYYDMPLKQIIIPLRLVKYIANITEILKLRSNINKTALQILCNDNTLVMDKIKEELGYNATLQFDNSIENIIKLTIPNI